MIYQKTAQGYYEGGGQNFFDCRRKTLPSSEIQYSYVHCRAQALARASKKLSKVKLLNLKDW